MPEIRSEDIYEAALDDEALARLPELLGRCVDATTAMLHWRFTDAPSEVGAAWNFEPERIAEYASTWQQHDLWFAAAQKPDVVNRVHHCSERVPLSQFERSLIYNEFSRTRAYNIFYCMGAAFVTPWGVGSIGVHRARDNKPFDVDALERLRPHTAAIGHVLKLRGTIAAARESEQRARHSLDTLAMAICVVRRDGRVLSMNADAQSVFARSDGLLVRAGKLSAWSVCDSAALEAAILKATASPPSASSLAVARAEGRAPWLIMVTPLIGAMHSGVAMIAFNDPEPATGRLAETLKGLFGLSRAESEIAVALCAGISVAEIVSRRDVSLNTVNTQVKSILAKMGCRRQAEIVAKIAALPRVKSPD